MALNIPNIAPANPWSDVVDVQNYLTDKALAQQIARAKATYAPYTEYANAASKIAYSNLLPYQIQATVLSNPLVMQALKQNPDLINSMVGGFQQSIPKGNNIFGNINLPSPQQMPVSNSLLGLALNKLFGPSQPEQKTQPNIMQQQSTPGVPMGEPVNEGMTPEVQNQSDESPLAAPKDASAQMVSKATRPYQQSNIKKGDLYRTDTGEVVLPPSSSTQESIEKQLLAINNAIDSAKDLGKESEEFLTPGGYRELKKAQASNWFEQNFFGIPTGIKKGLKVDPDKVSRYANWLAKQGKATETIMNAFNLPKDQEALKLVKHIVEPLPGETKEGYTKRMVGEINDLKTRYQRGEKLITHGFEVGNKNFKLPKFKNEKELNDWYWAQSDEIKAQARKALGES